MGPGEERVWLKKATENLLLRCRSLGRRTEGVVAVEFAILGTILLLFIGGIIDLGHAWYMKQVVTNASREGARYGVTFRVDSHAARIKPNAISPSISSYVTNNYLSNATLPSDANPTVIPSGTGYTSGVKGDPLQVTVTAVKTWWLIGTLIGQPRITLQATTMMQLE